MERRSLEAVARLARDPASREDQRIAAMPRTAPRHIMVIDDDPVVRDLVQELLTDEGYAVTCLEEAGAAEAAIRSFRPDLLILDLRFGAELAGLALIDRLQRDPATQAIRAVICSADSRALHEHATALEERQIAAIAKPFDLDELLTVIEQQWSRADERRATSNE
jgi:CheY-like chemotaxis protein